MPFIGNCWQGARFIASCFGGVIKSGFTKMYSRAMRRRMAEQSEGGRRVEARRAYNVLEKGALKRCIYRIQANDTTSTIKKLLERLERDMNYKGNPARLRRLLHELGLHPIVSSNQNEYFLEKARTRLMRTKYLQDLTKYREEGRPIIYTALSSVKLPRLRNLLDHRAVMVYAASKSGVIKDAITVSRYNMPVEQWYYMIRYESYEEWIRNKLLPNLPPNSVVVMRSTPWNKTIVTKTAMEGWLQERRIPYDTNATKSELRKLINLNKAEFEPTTIDDMLKENNHDVLRLPPFHDDLNPLEVAWLSVQQYVALETTRNNLSQVVRLTRDKLSMVGQDQMSEYYRKTSLIETGYRMFEMHGEIINNQISLEESVPQASTSSFSVNLEAGNNMVGRDKKDEGQEQSKTIADAD